MRKNQIKVDHVYAVRVSGKIVPVVITKAASQGGWWGKNLETGREVRIRTAGRLRHELSRSYQGDHEARWLRVDL